MSSSEGHASLLQPAREHPWDFPTTDDYETVSIGGHPLVHYDYEIRYKDRTYWYYDPRMTRVRVRDWDAFRDPGRLYYRVYVHERNRQWSRLTSTLEGTSVLDNFDRIGEAWITHLATAYAPFRHFEYGLSLALGHPTRFILGTPLQQAAAYSSYDRMAFSQFITRYVLLLERRAPRVRDQAMEAWTGHEGFQPLRRATEQLLACDDPVEILLVSNLLLGPAVDRLLVHHVSRLSLDNGDFVNAQLLRGLEDQNTWSANVGASLATFTVDQQTGSRWDYLRTWGHLTPDYRFGAIVPDPTADAEEEATNEEVLNSWLRTWLPLVTDAVTGLRFVLDSAPQRSESFDDAYADVQAHVTALLKQGGLKVPEPTSTAAV
jgi:phenol/toluene 2-monooxygenase (NADH) P1/A1